MAVTISTSQDWDSAARAAGEATTIQSGAVLTVNTDTRYHKNAPASGTGTFGAITMTAVTGGELLIDGRYVRWLPYTGGSGVAPAYDTDIVGNTSGATGKLLGVYSALNAAPTAVGAAISSTGFIKLKSASSTYNASEALTGITASTNGVDVTGWIEVIKDDGTDITIARAQKITVRSDWFYLDETTGSSQVIQLPTTGGSSTMYPGVWIETSSGSSTYEFWPAQRYTAALSSGWYSTAKGTDERSKFVEMQDGGAIRIGANTAGAYGYIPPSGCKVRIPNVLMMSCATASRASNSLPHATVASRPEFVVTSAGNVDIQGCLSTWYFNFGQAYSVILKNTAIVDNFAITECATAFELNEFHTANYLNTDVNNATFTSNLAGGTATKCKWGRCGARAASDYGTYITYSKDITFTDCWFEGRIFRTNAAAYVAAVAYCDNIRFIRPVIVGGGLNYAAVTNGYVEDPIYADSYHTTASATTPPVGVIQFGAGCVDSVLKGGGWWSGLDNMNVDTAFLYLTGATNTRWHTCGTPSVPIAGGSANRMLYACNDAGNNIGVEIKRVYFDDLGTTFYTSVNSSKGVILENCASAYADTDLVFDCLDGVQKGLKAAAADTAFTSVYGTIFYNLFTAATTGRVGLTFNEDTATYAAYVNKMGLTGASGFSATGLLYLYNLGDVIEYEFPYYVLGYTGFAASNVVVGGSNTGNLGVKYKIDVNNGNGYSSTWADATSANLTGETIDPDAGFKLKVQITCNTAGTNYLNSLYFAMVTDATEQYTNYPLDVATISLSGFTVGTRIQLYDVNASTELYNSVPTTSTLDYSVEYLADKPIRVRAMYADSSTANMFVEFTDTLRVTGLSRTIDVVPDSVYATNGIAGSSVTEVIIDDTNLLVNVDSGSISYAKIYAYETYWLTTAAGIRDEGRFIEAVDPTNYLFTDFKIKNVSDPSVPLMLTGGYGRNSSTLAAADLIDNTGGTIFCTPDHVVAYASGSGSGATAADVWGYSSRTLSSGGVSAIQSGLATSTDIATALNTYDAPTKAELDSAQAAIQADIAGVSGGLTVAENAQLMNTLTTGKFLALK